MIAVKLVETARAANGAATWRAEPVLSRVKGGQVEVLLDPADTRLELADDHAMPMTEAW